MRLFSDKEKDSSDKEIPDCIETIETFDVADLEFAGMITAGRSSNTIVYNLSDSGKKIFAPFKIDKVVPDVNEWIRFGHFSSALMNLPENASDILIQSEEMKVKRSLD